MFFSLKSLALNGIESIPIDVEVDVSNGLPSFTIVGLPDSSIKESKERIRAALINSGFSFPQKRITVNLSPSSIRKQGTFYDLPIALCILIYQNKIDINFLKDSIIFGELSLDGSVKKTKGALVLGLSAKTLGFKNIIASFEDRYELYNVKDLNLYLINSLKDIFNLKLYKIESSKEDNAFHEELSLDDVIGQSLAKFGCALAAAGFHNIVFVGPPGSGKSMLAKRLSSLMPPLSEDESLEISKIYSLAGLLNGPLIKRRPFRAINKNISLSALLGGGSFIKPGEVSLSHKGVLFLDEMLEFNKAILEALRQPLEDRFVNISRVKETQSFPADFLLAGAFNPCSCGYYGDFKKRCVCTENQVKRYQEKLSGPMLDRIEIFVGVNSLDDKELLKREKDGLSQKLKDMVNVAYERQSFRYKNKPYKFNSRIEDKELEKFCNLTKDAKLFLKEAIKNLRLSARLYAKLLKLSRTSADMRDKDSIEGEDIMRAFQFRPSNFLISETL